MAVSKGRKPALDAFASGRKPKQLLSLMTTKNAAAAPEGFERTVAARDMPVLAAEMAAGQSLKAGRKSQKEPVGLARYFARKTAYHKGDKE